MLKDGFYCMDCMAGMQEFPDKYFDLAIVDPVYGGVTQGGYMTNRAGGGIADHPEYNLALWRQEKTGAEYFRELFRVSKNQIIWGGNYFAVEIGQDSQGWIVWDKQHQADRTFADCELAWTSFDRATRIFRFMWDGMLQGNMKNKEKKIHPTQKPVALYNWILARYAQEGNIILDTHVGSASSLIACHRAGFRYVGFEIDRGYYEAARERLEAATAQVSMFGL
jgi:site-specific DNA-methyltransferase (adenine-specific)